MKGMPQVMFAASLLLGSGLLFSGVCLNNIPNRTPGSAWAWGQIETFDQDNYLDLVYNPDGTQDNHLLEYSHQATGGYEGGCAKFKLINTGVEDEAGLGMVRYPATQQVNVGYMVKFGSDWERKVVDYKHVLIYDQVPDGVKHTRPMVFSDAVLDKSSRVFLYRTLTSCNNAAGICGDEFGHEYPSDHNNRHSFQMRNYTEQWLYVEFEVTIGGYNDLYMYSRDGTISGRIGRSENINQVSRPLVLAKILAYMEGASNVTDESYALIDNVMVNNTFMGPPEGFVLSTSVKDRNVKQLTGDNVLPTVDKSGIHFKVTLETPGSYTLAVLDLAGRSLWNFSAENAVAGSHTATWDGHSADVGRVNHGVYIMSLTKEGKQVSKSFVVPGN